MMWVPLLNFEGVPGPMSQSPEVPDPEVLVPLLHHALEVQGADMFFWEEKQNWSIGFFMKNIFIL